MKQNKLLKFGGGIFLVLILAALPFMAACPAPAPAPPEEVTPTPPEEALPPKPLKIGLMYAVTGPYSSMGADSGRGAETYVELINERGGIKGHPIEAVYSNSQSDATKAVLAVRKLIEVHKVHAIGGCNSTGVALSVGPVCEEWKVPFMTATGSEVFEYLLKPYWSFRNCISGWEIVDWAFASLNNLDPEIKNIAVLYAASAFGKALYDNTEMYAPLRGLKIVAAEKYDIAATDFGAQISTIMAANPDCVVVWTAEKAGALAIKQMREMGMDKIILANGTISARAVQEAFADVFSIPPYVYGIGDKQDCWWLLPKDSDDYKIVYPIATRYEEKYDERYGWYAHISIANLIVITNAFERALDEDPDLLDRDLLTIRTAIRNNIETMEELNTGGITLIGSATNHNLAIPASGMATYHWEHGEMVYDLELCNITLNPPPPMPE